MDGKVLAGLAAIALSSASAGVVGVVSTGLVSFRSDEVRVNPPSASGGAAPGTRVVIDTARNHLASIPDPPDHGGAGCGNAAGGRCILLSPATGVTLTIFGHTVSLPTDWYGLEDGEDIYDAGGLSHLSALLGDPRQPAKNALPGLTDQDNEEKSSNNGVTQTNGNSNAPNDFPSLSPFDDLSGVLAAPSLLPNGEAPTILFLSDAVTPQASIPEPSTWAMLLAGFAALGFAGFRRAKSGAAVG